jgi:hypothetical protein
MELLQQPHNFKVGDRVFVTERYDPNLSFKGTIYSIMELPLNRGLLRSGNNNILVDHFYVKLDEAAYAKLLKRGSEFIYNGRPMVVGSIKTNTMNGTIDRITSQELFSSYETKLDPKNINAMLIWRIGYNIEKN